MGRRSSITDFLNQAQAPPRMKTYNRNRTVLYTAYVLLVTLPVYLPKVEKVMGSAEKTVMENVVPTTVIYITNLLNCVIKSISKGTNACPKQAGAN